MKIGKYHGFNYSKIMIKESVGNRNMHDILIYIDYEHTFSFDRWVVAPGV